MLARIPCGPVVPLFAPREHSLGFAPPVLEGKDVNSLCGNLTARQREVLAVLLQGKSNKEICRALDLAEPTVKNHITAILKALNVSNRTEAVIKVTRASQSSLSYTYTIVSSYSPFKQR